MVTNDCATDTTSITLQVFNLPQVDAGEDLTTKKGEAVQLEASGAADYRWETAVETLSCVLCPSPFARPDTTTTYTVTGIDNNGCQSTDEVTVTVLDGPSRFVDPVNTFTPNNDGVNDFFVIRGIENYPDHKLTVINRWGDTVFESLEYENDWDGTYNGGPLPAGTYLYVLVIEDGGERDVTRSTITIIR